MFPGSDRRAYQQLSTPVFLPTQAGIRPADFNPRPHGLHPMNGYSTLVIFLTVCELVLLLLVVLFFSRLRRSEDLLAKLQKNQDALLKKIDFNARIEQELVGSFQRRQVELAELDQKLEVRRVELEKLVKKAKEFSRSPDFLRQIILNGARRGQSPQALAKATGLSLDEVELILAQNND
jgi:hypothetical protein